VPLPDRDELDQELAQRRVAELRRVTGSIERLDRDDRVRLGSVKAIQPLLLEVEVSDRSRCLVLAFVFHRLGSGGHMNTLDLRFAESLVEEFPDTFLRIVGFRFGLCL